MKAYTDYPFFFLGDTLNEEAPIREVDVLAYDKDKYCVVFVKGFYTTVKSVYLYESEGRYEEVPSLSKLTLSTLPVYV
jgi:hypothetical protein